MKKNLMTFAAVLCCSMISVMFCACSSETEIEDPLTDKTPVTGAKMDCILKISAESLVSFDFFVKYYNAEGTIQSEKVAWTDAASENGIEYKQWKKLVTTSLPSTLGMYFEIKPKEDIDLSDPNKMHTFIYDEGVYISSVRESGANYQLKQVVLGSKGSTKSSKIEAAFSSPCALADIIVTFDKDGNVVSERKWESITDNQ